MTFPRGLRSSAAESLEIHVLRGAIDFHGTNAEQKNLFQENLGDHLCIYRFGSVGLPSSGGSRAPKSACLGLFVASTMDAQAGGNENGPFGFLFGKKKIHGHNEESSKRGIKSTIDQLFFAFRNSNPESDQSSDQSFYQDPQRCHALLVEFTYKSPKNIPTLGGPGSCLLLQQSAACHFYRPIFWDELGQTEAVWVLLGVCASSR